MKELRAKESAEQIGKKAGKGIAKFITAVIVAAIFGIPLIELVLMFTNNQWIATLIGIVGSILFFSAFLEDKPK
ncbi:hypothetical protein [Idiomarina loihiensis]|uniref:hypothetical protein n=1 Tax=Idiomarina loihiensis TaxID=135577 RepID=UPI0031583190